ncbi:MAG: hypothetical protein ACLGJD_18165 [Gammaproteobacteria bacterium]|uniref:hypothetical protein n=1 Tax=uncultured Pseudacidovorax sp. TaxID=679313 RepID=UPI0025D968BD|nr:hypothetical protein [uncultured Pseudacidovorax sp.]
MSGIDQRFSGPFGPVSPLLLTHLSPLMRRLLCGAEESWRVRVLCAETGASWTSVYQAASADDAETFAHADAHALAPRCSHSVEAFEHLPARRLWELRLRWPAGVRPHAEPAVIGRVVATSATEALDAVRHLLLGEDISTSLSAAPKGSELVLLAC